MFLRNIRLRTKLSVAGVILTFIPLLVSVVVIDLQNSAARKTAVVESAALAKDTLGHVVRNVHNIYRTQHAVHHNILAAHLNMLKAQLRQQGGLHFSDEPITWEAVNQHAPDQTDSVNLPKITVGGQWLGQIDRVDMPVAVLDPMKSFDEHINYSIYQRMNQAGDMLRVATTIVDLQGRRQIGRYLPAAAPQDDQPHSDSADASANIMRTVLRGQTCFGISPRVIEYEDAVYDPIFDQNHNIIGLLYVGLNRVSAESFRTFANGIQIGDSGGVFTFDTDNATLTSPGGLRKTEPIGPGDPRLEIVRDLPVLKENQLKFYEFSYKIPGINEHRPYIAAGMSYPPLNVMISGGTVIHEFMAGPEAIGKTASQGNVTLTIMAFVLMGLSAVIWYFISGIIAKPIVDSVGAVHGAAIERDLTHHVPVTGNDEMGMMATEFNAMTKSLRLSLSEAITASRKVLSFTQEMAKGATINRERTADQEKQMAIVQHTIKEMAATAAKMADAALRQKQAAEASKKDISKLIERIGVVAKASLNQVQEARTASEKVTAMGDAGAMVVAKAQQQGQQVFTIVEALQQMNQAVQSLNHATENATASGQKSLDTVARGRKSVEATVAGMRSIAACSEQISEIITVITKFAEQTNMLSMSAAIEAARAGTLGKGFALVADEVGKLAHRSSEAALEITQLIKNSLTKVAEGTRLSKKSRTALERIAQSSQANIAAIERIATASGELSKVGVEVDRMMADLNTLAKAIAANAGQQAEHRQVAQNAIIQLVGQANNISMLIENAQKEASGIGRLMPQVISRTSEIITITGIQTQRSRKLMQVSEESYESARQTAVSAHAVVKITDELQGLSRELTGQIGQFKVYEGPFHEKADGGHEGIKHTQEKMQSERTYALMAQYK
ncbi:MAG: Cache 3/Cache 2 fusion domain-containing protein [Desulfatitalea sp.]|nr:Cache 3/Cache 2 fusion domain-containing protein [Desulfatitalea sp.]